MALIRKNKKLIVAMSAAIVGTAGIASSIIITDKHQSVEEKLTSAIENVTNDQILKLEQQLQRVSPINYENYLSWSSTKADDVPPPEESNPNKPGTEPSMPDFDSQMASELIERTNQEKYSYLMAISAEYSLGLVSWGIMLSDEDFLSNTTLEIIEGLKNAAEQNLTMNEFEEIGGDVILLKKSMNQYGMIKEFQQISSGNQFEFDARPTSENLEKSSNPFEYDGSSYKIYNLDLLDSEGNEFIHSRKVNDNYENFIPFCVMLETQNNEPVYTLSDDHKQFEYKAQIVLVDKKFIDSGTVRNVMMENGNWKSIGFSEQMSSRDYFMTISSNIIHDITKAKEFKYETFKELFGFDYDELFKVQSLGDIHIEQKPTDKALSQQDDIRYETTFFESNTVSKFSNDPEEKFYYCGDAGWANNYPAGYLNDADASEALNINITWNGGVGLVPFYERVGLNPAGVTLEEFNTRLNEIYPGFGYKVSVVVDYSGDKLVPKAILGLVPTFVNYKGQVDAVVKDYLGTDAKPDEKRVVTYGSGSLALHWNNENLMNVWSAEVNLNAVNIISAMNVLVKDVSAAQGNFTKLADTSLTIGVLKNTMAGLMGIQALIDMALACSYFTLGMWPMFALQLAFVAMDTSSAIFLFLDAIENYKMNDKYTLLLDTIPTIASKNGLVSQESINKLSDHIDVYQSSRTSQEILESAAIVNNDASAMLKTLEIAKYSDFVAKMCEICELEVDKSAFKGNLYLPDASDVNNSLVFATLNMFITNSILLYLTCTPLALLPVTEEEYSQSTVAYVTKIKTLASQQTVKIMQRLLFTKDNDFFNDPNMTEKVINYFIKTASQLKGNEIPTGVFGGAAGMIMRIVSPPGAKLRSFLSFAKFASTWTIINNLLQAALILVIAHFRHNANQIIEGLAEIMTGERPDFDNWFTELLK